jgi:hypothetical protein
MRYDVHVAPHHGGDRTRFEHEQEEPLKEGDFITTNISYRVERVTPCGDDNAKFDAVVEAIWAAGPAQASFHP